MKHLLLVFKRRSDLNICKDISNILLSELLKVEIGLEDSIALMIRVSGIDIFNLLIRDIHELMFETILNEFALRVAGQYNQVKTIEYLNQLGIDDWDEVMRGAAIGGHKELINFCIDKGAENWDKGMYGAALGGHRDLVEFFIISGIVEGFTEALYNASLGGHKDLVEFFIDKEADTWGSYEMGYGMIAASRGGHVELVKFFIEQGAGIFVEAMNNAISRGHKQIVDILIEAGKNGMADDYEKYEEYSLEVGNKEIAEIFRKEIERRYMNRLYF